MTALKRYEITFGVMACVLLFAMLSSYIYNHLHEEKSLSTERILNKSTHAALSVELSVLRIRELEKELMLTRNPEAANQLQTQLQLTARKAAELQAGDQRATFTDLMAALSAYEHATQQAITLLASLGLDHNSGLEGELRRAAHAVEKTFQELENPKLLAQLMYLRRHEKDFMMRLDERYIEKYDRAMQQLQNAVIGEPIPNQLKQSILGNLTTYQTSFDRWTATRSDLFRLTQRLDERFSLIVTEIDAIASKILDSAQQLEDRGDRAKFASEISLIMTGLLGFLFLGVLLRLVFKQQDMAQEIQQLANHDMLTLLPNRRGFAEELERQLDLYPVQDQKLLVGLVDLDGFKSVNDVYGHTAGDALLHTAAERIKYCMPKGTFIARLGGDEFGLFTAVEDDAAEIRQIGQRLSAELKRPFHLKEGIARIGGSAGFTFARQTDSQIGSLVERADYALYYAKEHCKGDVVLFSDQHERLVDRVRILERRLLSADFEDEIDVVFQPILNPTTGEVKGMETLARWQCASLGTVPPSEFIPLAERAGRINEITQIVLQKALDSAKEWREDIFLSVNLSALDIASQEAASHLLRIIEQTEFETSRLVFEVTETVFMNQIERTNVVLNQFKALGIEIALDDFGTGYSSLNYLQHMTLDRLKIDRSFIADIEKNTVAQKILFNVLRLCASIEIDCIIEGVERESQRQILASFGAKLVQGYYFAVPMSKQDATAYTCDPTVWESKRQSA